MTSNISHNYNRYFLGTKSFFNSIIKKKRIEINKIIEDEINFEKSKNLLDVGTTSSLESHENQIIKHFYDKIDISCLSNLSLEELKSIYSKISVHIGDGREMSFVNNNFDM